MTWPFLVSQLHGSPFWMGLISASAFAPLFLWNIPAGYLNDRISSRAISLMGALGLAATFFLIAIMHQFQILTLPLLAIFVFLMGSCGIFYSTAARCLLAQVAPVEKIHQANSLFEANFAVSGIIGPLIGGLLIQYLGTKTTLFIQSAMLLTMSLPISQIHLPAAAPPRDLKIQSGWRFLFDKKPANRLLGATLIYGTVIFASVMIAFQMGPFFFKNDLGFSAPQVSVALMTCAALATLLSLFLPFLIERFGQGPLLLSSAFTSTLALLVLSQTTSLLGACLALSLAISATKVIRVIRMNLLINLTPKQILGQIMGVYLTINDGIVLFSTCLAGIMAQSLGFRWTFIGFAMVALLSLPIFWAGPLKKLKNNIPIPVQA